MQYKVAVTYQEVMWYSVDADTAEEALTLFHDSETEDERCTYEYTEDGDYLYTTVYDESGQRVLEE